MNARTVWKRFPGLSWLGCRPLRPADGREGDAPGHCAVTLSAMAMPTAAFVGGLTSWPPDEADVKSGREPEAEPVRGARERHEPPA